MSNCKVIALTNQKGGVGKTTTAEKQGFPTRDNVARQAVDEAISKSFTLKDFDRLMAEMGYKCSFDPNRKYWTIIGRGWKRPKRLYKLGEDYTNERIMERIRENSYAVKFARFTEPQKQIKVYRLKAPEPKSMRELVSAMIDASPVPFQPMDNLELPAYYDSGQQTIFIRTGLNEEQLFVSMSKEVAAAVFDFKHNESRDASDFKAYCVAYMVSSRYGVDTRGFNFDRLPKEYAEMETQDFKGELGSMRDVLGEVQSEMYKSMEKNKPARNKEQER